MRLTIELASGKILPPVNAEWINIAVFDDGELAHMEGATPQLSLDQARMEMLKWLPYGTRPTADLYNYLKAVKLTHWILTILSVDFPMDALLVGKNLDTAQVMAAQAAIFGLGKHLVELSH